jgi:major intracellular serine protease
MNQKPKLWRYTIKDVAPQAERPWNIDQVAAPSFWEKSRGGGAVVAVIDTGLDVNHPEFSGCVYKPRNLTSNLEWGVVTDKVGHGTHVAGIIAGKTCGVAPEARIMPLKVFPDAGGADVGLCIQEAFKVILDHNKTAAPADKVVTVNCSFGGQVYDSIMAYFIRTLVSQGVTVVVSAGNAGDGDPSTHEVFSYPAYIWECLTVGATDRNSKSAGYSNSFDGIDLGAPGTEIYSAWPGGGYKLLSGTSMAAPHVTGAIALLYDAWRKREGAWPTEDEAVSILLSRVRKVPIDPFLVGEGILSLAFDTLPKLAAKEIILKIGSVLAMVDGRAQWLDQAPVIDRVSDRTLVPLRFMAENFGYLVDWDGTERKITSRKVGV